MGVRRRAKAPNPQETYGDDGSAWASVRSGWRRSTEKKAAACLEVADRMSLHKDRALMVEMARHWLDLAERIEAAGE